MKTIIKTAAIGVILLTMFCIGAYSQKQDKAQVKSWVDNGNFIFKAETMNPMRGPSRQLTSEYDVRVTSDALTSYLPYFGRAFIAPIDPADAGNQFTSKDFSYTILPGKKGSWDITIKPADSRNVREMNFTVFDNGSATLQVTSNNRDAISYDGYIAELKVK